MLDRDDKVLMAARKHWSAAYVGYWIDKPSCEACGIPAEPPHHIRTRGAGGSDDAGNLLSLCVVHHKQAHTEGVETFAARYPKLAGKIRRALGRKA